MAITKSNVLTHLNASGLVIEKGNWAAASGADTTGTLTPDQTTSPKIGEVYFSEIVSNTPANSVTKSRAQNSYSIVFAAGDSGVYTIVGKSF